MTTPPPDRWGEVSAARLPTSHLAALAPLRARDDIRVHPEGEVTWVRWPAGRPEVVQCLLPIPGLVFFVQRGGQWFRFGSRLPSDPSPPEGEGRTVAGVLSPGRFEPITSPAVAWEPVQLRVVRGGDPKPATALVCVLADLAKWADVATTAELGALRAARSEDRVIVFGSRLPSIPASIRFWGSDVLCPVGFRPEPDLPPVALRQAAGVSENELLLLDETGVEAIPREAFEPLTRAGVRLGATRS